MSRSRLSWLMIIPALIAVLVVAPLPSDAFHAHVLPLPPRVTEANGVTREVLSDGMPAKAPGQQLLLLRFTFVPGAVIPPHTHPGMQTAYVVSGTLGYTVFCGYAEVVRAATDGVPQQRERLDPGVETFFHPGDAFTEVDGIVHAGRNAGPDPLVLLVSSLFADDAPPSSPASPDHEMGDHTEMC
jgi:quercetin dioxygenase-like cupin family protein